MQNKKLYRSETDYILAGVAGGLGEYFEVDPALIRVILIVLALAGGSGLLLYLILWLVLPKKSRVKQGSITKETLEENARDMEEKAKQVIKKLENSKEKHSPEEKVKSQNNRTYWLGFGLMIIGVLLLLQSLNIIHHNMFWPMVLILLGLATIAR